jgi:thiol-disulfide isomerase/thioredoxin
MPGAVLLEFGANWCGHCMAAQAPLAEAMPATKAWPTTRSRMAPAGRWAARSASSCGRP